MQEHSTNIVPSLLSCDLLNIERELGVLAKLGIKRLHFDVMDGHYVPNISFGPALLRYINAYGGFDVDVHLMVDPLEPFLDMFLKYGMSSLAFHPESCDSLKGIEFFRKCYPNLKIGLALNPNTDLPPLMDLLFYVDFVLVMGVMPGFGGQHLMRESLDTLRILKEHRESTNVPYELRFDGGITPQTMRILREASLLSALESIVVGHFLFNKQEDPLVTLYRERFNQLEVTV